MLSASTQEYTEYTTSRAYWDTQWTSVEAERVQLGSGLLTFNDISRGFYYLAALFAVSIPVLVFPVPNLFTRPSFPKKKPVNDITISCRYRTRVKHGHYSGDVGLP